MNITIDLADSEYLYPIFSTDGKEISLFFTLWNDENMQIMFHDVIAFCFLSRSDTIGMQSINEKSEFLDLSLHYEYEHIPNNHEYCCYEFLNLDEQPFIKIVAKSYSIIRQWYKESRSAAAFTEVCCEIVLGKAEMRNWAGYTRSEGRKLANKLASEAAKKEASKKLASCFLAGMVVSRYSPETERQRELTPIENIRIGDSVWAFNRVTKNWEPQVVLDTFARPYDGDQVNVYFWNEKVESTGGHPFWVLDGNDLAQRPPCDCLPPDDQLMTSVGRWIYARHLQVGDVVQSRLTGNAKVTALELSYVQTTVYNFLVDVLHNYAVGHGEVLVHNNNGMGEKAPLPEKSDHAKHQAGQGRPTGPACSDAQNVPMRNLFVQDDGRYVVIGANGRVHIFEADGTHVTSFWNSATNTKERLAEGRWSLSSLDEYEQFKSLF